MAVRYLVYNSKASTCTVLQLFKTYLSERHLYVIVKDVKSPIIAIKEDWTYGIQLWGTSSKSNVTIIERLQSKMLRIITIAPWFVRNGTISRNLQISTVKEEIERFSANYMERLHFHPNALANSLVKNIYGTRRLKWKHVLTKTINLNFL